MRARPFTSAEKAEIEQALAHALQFGGRKRFKVSGEMIAKIATAHLVQCLGRASFVAMMRPDSQGNRAPMLRSRERPYRKRRRGAIGSGGV